MTTRMKNLPFRTLGAVALVTALAACNRARSTNASAQDDLKRDLDLASAQTMTLATAKVDPSLLNDLETKPQGAPQKAAVLKKGPGSRAVHSRTPTVKAAPDPAPAATEENGPSQTVAEAPAPDASEPVAVAPRPAPAPSQPAGDYGTGGGVIFGGGGIGGVILRGGGRDGDNCDIHTRGGRHGTARGPIYMPTIPIATQPSGPATQGPIGRGGSRRGF